MAVLHIRRIRQQRDGGVFPRSLAGDEDHRAKKTKKRKKTASWERNTGGRINTSASRYNQTSTFLAQVNRPRPTTSVRVNPRYETKVRMVWGTFLIAAAALQTPTRNGYNVGLTHENYNVQGVNLTFLAQVNRPRPTISMYPSTYLSLLWLKGPRTHMAVLYIGRSGLNLKPGTVCVCGTSDLRKGMNTTEHPPSPASRAFTDPPTNVHAVSRAICYVHTSSAQVPG